MGEGYPVGNRAAPMLIALAATLTAALLLSATPAVGAAEHQPVIISNGSLCSGVNGDGGGEDGGCLTIGQMQPELEGFEMALDLGSGAVFHRSLAGTTSSSKTLKIASMKGAVCGLHKNGRYFLCTTDPKYGGGNSQKCATLARDNRC